MDRRTTLGDYLVDQKPPARQRSPQPKPTENKVTTKPDFPALSSGKTVHNVKIPSAPGSSPWAKPEPVAPVPTSVTEPEANPKPFQKSSASLPFHEPTWQGYFALSEKVYDADKEKFKKLAWFGDSLFGSAVVTLLFQNSSSSSDLASLNDQKELYVGNQVMARYIERSAPHMKGFGYNDHTLGSFFEATFGLLVEKDPQASLAFVKFWKNWVDETIKHKVMWVSSSKFIAIDGEIVETSAVRGSGREQQNLGRVTGEKQTLMALAPRLKKIAQTAVSLRQEVIFRSIEEMPDCPHDQQRRSIIFLCSDEVPCLGCKNRLRSCGSVWKQCMNCHYATNLEDLTRGRDVVPALYRWDEFRQFDVSEDDLATSGMPLNCPLCESSRAFGLNHCSLQYRCNVGACSIRYPCKRFTGWKCLECDGAGRFKHRFLGYNF